jgi:hypothetical protein
MSDGLDINRSLKPAQKITHIRDYQAGISTCLITQFGLVSTHLILRIGRTIQWELSLTPTSHAYATAVPPLWGYHIAIVKHGSTFHRPEECSLR